MIVPSIENYDLVQTKAKGYFEDSNVEEKVTNVLAVFANPLKSGSDCYIGLKSALGSENNYVNKFRIEYCSEANILDKN
jgi:hypothetical protein